MLHFFIIYPADSKIAEISLNKGFCSGSIFGVGGVIICGVYTAVVWGVGTELRVPNPSPDGDIGRRAADTVSFIGSGVVDSMVVAGCVVGFSSTIFFLCGLTIKYSPSSVITNAKISEI